MLFLHWKLEARHRRKNCTMAPQRSRELKTPNFTSQPKKTKKKWKYQKWQAWGLHHQSPCKSQSRPEPAKISATPYASLVQTSILTRNLEFRLIQHHPSCILRAPHQQTDNWAMSWLGRVDRATSKAQRSLLHHYRRLWEQWIRIWAEEPKSESRKRKTKPHKSLRSSPSVECLQRRCSCRHTKEKCSNPHTQRLDSGTLRSKQPSTIPSATTTRLAKITRRPSQTPKKKTQIPQHPSHLSMIRMNPTLRIHHGPPQTPPNTISTANWRDSTMTHFPPYTNKQTRNWLLYGLLNKDAI